MMNVIKNILNMKIKFYFDLTKIYSKKIYPGEFNTNFPALFYKKKYAYVLYFTF